MRVMVAGTFDIIHPGHIYLLNEARGYGDVYVVIARDVTVHKVKGKRTVFDEEERKLIVGSLRMVEKAVLGDTEDMFKSVEELKPDIIFLGPDQDDTWLRERIRSSGMDIAIKRLERRLNYASSWTKDVLQRLHRIEEEG
jgi:FAD synthetase